MPLVLASMATRALNADEFRLVFLTGDDKTVDVAEIDTDGTVQLDGGTNTSLEELREIQRRPTVADADNGSPRATQRKSGPDDVTVVRLVDGGRVSGTLVTMDDEYCTVQGHGLFDGDMKVPIDYVVSLTQGGDVPSVITTGLRAARDEDQFYVRVDGNIETIDGLLERLDEEQVSFLWNDKARTVPRQNVVAVGIASSDTTFAGKCKLHFQNGAVLLTTIHQLKENQLTVSLIEDETFVVRWADVDRIEVRSDRLKYLSDLSPVVDEHKPIVTMRRKSRVDKNVSGGVLRIGKRTFSKGIGVAAYSRLRYQLENGFTTFCATIGIDADTEGRGDCVFVVQGNGKELARHAMRGTDEPRRIQLKISSIRELELIVETGNDLDLSDHANWCDACLIRE